MADVTKEQVVDFLSKMTVLDLAAVALAAEEQIRLRPERPQLLQQQIMLRDLRQRHGREHS